MPGPPLYLRQNISEPNLPLSLVLRGVPPPATPSESVIAKIFWRWDDDPTMEPVPLGEVAAGKTLAVPFNLGARSVRLFLVGQTAKGTLSALRPEDGAQFVIAGNAAPPPQSNTYLAAENLAANNLVNIFTDTDGVAKVRRADASVGYKPANGFVTTAYLSGMTAIVQTSGTVGGFSGLTTGQTIYLSTTTPGGIQTAAPTDYGQLSQVVGTAASATTVTFMPEPGRLIIPSD
jgi:hypothetical protein